jgi:hypothetical protein
MMRDLVIAIGFALAATTTSSAQLPFEQQPKNDPYRDLFSPETERLKVAAAAALRAKQEEMKPCVNYTMRVVPADPTVDPKIRVAPPSDGVEHTIKIVKPPVCKP